MHPTDSNPVQHARRALLGAAALSLAGCGSPLPLDVAPGRDAAAVERLRQSAEAHGYRAYRQLRDINVGYDGQWRPLIARLQPELIDPGFRGSSQERLVPASRTVGQRHTGPAGTKQVAWRRGSGPGALGQVDGWLNGVPSRAPAILQTSALVAEGYCLFLLGPLWLVELDLPMRLQGAGTVDGRTCDVVEAWLSPGLGMVATDRLSLWIDQRDHTMRRIRFTLEGFDSTQGAVAEVEMYDHLRRFGVLWPTRFYERLKHPLPLPVHDWRLTGLDVDRGYAPNAITGERFEQQAVAPATPLHG